MSTVYEKQIGILTNKAQTMQFLDSEMMDCFGRWSTVGGIESFASISVRPTAECVQINYSSGWNNTRCCNICDRYISGW